MGSEPDNHTTNPFDALRFDNAFTGSLPADPVRVNRTRHVVDACYSLVDPTPVSRPTLAAYSPEVMDLLGLPSNTHASSQFVATMAGNVKAKDMITYASRYGGHQFGHWAGQLGDGRAISLGEVLAQDGRRWELQLKGSGPTPYSRMADGRAVMRSSVREFLCSEAMYHLGIPTTRALSLVSTGDTVMRDMFYDGNAAAEPGAIVCRVSPSFIRFGHFEILTAQRETDLLRQLVDFTLTTYFSNLGPPSTEAYLDLLDEVARRTISMVTDWMRVGFVHGVMNTDNMSILGLTIDYGPYGWLEDYNPTWTPNTTDAQGRRYAFGRQPSVALWNLSRLASALFPLIGDVDCLQDRLGRYRDQLDEAMHVMMLKKLGLAPNDRKTDDLLVGELHAILSLVETDMTLFYRALGDLDLTHIDQHPALAMASLRRCYYQDSIPQKVQERTFEWLRMYAEQAHVRGTSEADRCGIMRTTNPLYVMRNYLAQLAIDEAEEGRYESIEKLLNVMRRPYEEQEGMDAYAQKRPEWARHRPGCSMLSCSS